jgi:uncharacterized membrane protein YgcG
VRTLNARLSEYQQATGGQLIVYVAPTTGDAPIEDWAVRAFAKWKVGRKGLDDGLALFIMPQDRKIRIEVGYGLEAIIPDAIASRVINRSDGASDSGRPARRGGNGSDRFFDRSDRQAIRGASA